MSTVKVEYLGDGDQREITIVGAGAGADAEAGVKAETKPQTGAGTDARVTPESMAVRSRTSTIPHDRLCLIYTDARMAGECIDYSSIGIVSELTEDSEGLRRYNVVLFLLDLCFHQCSPALSLNW